MSDFYANHEQAGKPLTRQISASLKEPSTLTDSQYLEFFRQNSAREEGWMEAKIGNAREWLKLFFIFDNGVLKYGSSPMTPDSDLLRIPMDNVVSLRADTSNGEESIKITTLEHKISLKPQGTDDMRRWLFCFQKSVALVLSNLMRPHQQQPQGHGHSRPHHHHHHHQGHHHHHHHHGNPARLGAGSGVGQKKDDSAWLRELGHGHGRHTAVTIKKRQVSTDHVGAAEATNAGGVDVIGDEEGGVGIAGRFDTMRSNSSKLPGEGGRQHGSWAKGAGMETMTGIDTAGASGVEIGGASAGASSGKSPKHGSGRTLSEGRRSLTAEHVYLAFRDVEAHQKSGSRPTGSAAAAAAASVGSEKGPQSDELGQSLGQGQRRGNEHGGWNGQQQPSGQQARAIPVEFGHVALPGRTVASAGQRERHGAQPEAVGSGNASGLSKPFPKRHVSADDKPSFAPDVLMIETLQLDRTPSIPINYNAGGAGNAMGIATAGAANSVHSRSPGASSSFGNNYEQMLNSSALSETSGGGGVNPNNSSSFTKIATSYKDSPDNHYPRLESLLMSTGNTPTTPRSIENSDDEGEEEDDDDEEDCGAFTSCSSDNGDNEDESYMMFELDEADTSHASSARNPSSSATRGKPASTAANTTGPKPSSGSRPDSPIPSPGDGSSTGRRSSFGLSNSGTGSPPQRNSITNAAGSSLGQGQGQGQKGFGMTSECSTGKEVGTMDGVNRSDYLMWECGFCSKLGPRNTNEDRFICSPNINDKLLLTFQNAESSVPRAEAVEEGAAAVAHPASPSSAATTSGPAEIDESGRFPGLWGREVDGDMLLGGGVPAAGGYFGVYDGHCGEQASAYLEEVLLETILRHPKFNSDLLAAISESCIQIDNDFLDLCEEKRLYCGTTALGAILLGSKLVVFNIGDCQAVLCSGGMAFEMNSSHKPGRPDEEQRVKQAGGWVTEEKELYMGRLHRMDLSDPLVIGKAKEVNWVTIHRVCGELAVSRSIGDPDYKRFVPGELVNAFFSWPDGHNQKFMADLVIPDPEFVVRELGAADEFLVLASDGLWDVVSPLEAVKFIRDAFASGKSPSQAADDLGDLALKLGSSDNVTIVITRFIHSVSAHL